MPLQSVKHRYKIHRAFPRVITILLLPILLILLDTGLNTLSVAKVIDGSQTW